MRGGGRESNQSVSELHPAKGGAGQRRPSLRTLNSEAGHENGGALPELGRERGGAFLEAGRGDPVFLQVPLSGGEKKTLSPHRQKFELRRSVRFRSPVVFPELSQSCGGAFWGRSCGRPGFRFPCQGGKKNAKSPPAELDFGGHDDFGVTVALRRPSGRGAFQKCKKSALHTFGQRGGSQLYI